MFWKKKTKIPFEDLVPAKSADALITDADAVAGLVDRSNTTVHYLLCSVSENEQKETDALVGQVVKHIRLQKGTVLAVICPIVYATFGFPTESSTELETRLTTTVAAIQGGLSENVKLVYGTAPGTYGILDFGGLGTILPQMERRISALLTLNGGQALRID